MAFQVRKLPVNTFLIGTVLCFVLLFNGKFIFDKTEINQGTIQMSQLWLDRRFVGERSDLLHEGIPDGWEFQSWGEATGHLKIVDEGFSGKHAVLIERNSPKGVIALVQDVAVEPGEKFVLQIASKGSGGRIQLRYRTAPTADWVDQGWFVLAASEDWTENRFNFKMPTDASEARVMLRVTGNTWLDDAFLGTGETATDRQNRLVNPGFEQDGVQEDPLAWWRRYVVGSSLPQLSGDWNPPQESYAKALNFIVGSQTNAGGGAGDPGLSCAEEPGYVSWLLAQDLAFEQAGGLAAQERLYQLAITLAPGCPQPYGRLAQLYRSNLGNWQAAEYYLKAGVLAGETTKAGEYFFEAGLLYLRQLGDFSRAIEAFQKAEADSGWERGIWYKGAASYFLGQALVSIGRIQEAKEAYQRVLSCRSCPSHHYAALERLRLLSGQ